MLIRRWTVVGHRVLHSRETTDASRPGRPPLVLVHGSGTTSRYFRPLLQALDGTVPAAAVELPGIGSSSADDIPTDVAGLADVLADWLRTTRRHPTTLVGNSMGCQVVTDVAIRHPELVERLVLIGPTVDRHRHGFFRQAALLLADAFRERPSLIATVLTDSALTNRSAALKYMRAALRHRIDQRLPLVRQPVLIVRGERDPMVTQPWVEELRDLTRDVRLEVVRGAGHGTHHGHPHVVAGLLEPLAPTHSDQEDPGDDFGRRAATSA
ncbi:alpha/beta fold hydrolase [Egicoccus halophilus]|uniref:AB hydrolase-1 domain-containing protein n=1 Tax=Egicoccus halophilus TaxID=1670830 RepID=A0A8J3EVJ8_9ACTN|nr:alpha/beta hydrolase [Egicoccus halophilus]GGI09311.1 hypothetical protein GCM10011354_33450 [Egicoccus halophilus]